MDRGPQNLPHSLLFGDPIHTHAHMQLSSTGRRQETNTGIGRSSQVHEAVPGMSPATHLTRMYPPLFAADPYLPGSRRHPQAGEWRRRCPRALGSRQALDRRGSFGTGWAPRASLCWRSHILYEKWGSRVCRMGIVQSEAGGQHGGWGTPANAQTPYMHGIDHAIYRLKDSPMLVAAVRGHTMPSGTGLSRVHKHHCHIN